jgi:phosphoserine aminotransferase
VLDEFPELYEGHAARDARSQMNVTFRLPSDELTRQFCAEAAQRKLTSLEGHRSVGGIRASIYNAMPMSGVEALRDFMLEFAKKGFRVQGSGFRKKEE